MQQVSAMAAYTLRYLVPIGDRYNKRVALSGLSIIRRPTSVVVKHLNRLSIVADAGVRDGNTYRGYSPAVRVVELRRDRTDYGQTGCVRPLSLFSSDASANEVREREIDASQAERLGRSCFSIARSALSLVHSAQAERDNESCFFMRAANVHRFIRRYHVIKISGLRPYNDSEVKRSKPALRRVESHIAEAYAPTILSFQIKS
ncbi:hypothetical protein EVAR_74236_1 [Eumeta japonica]|uniref:Uncharacterized protein n=1 Tax=Eumeta variegata TaxID=151549 RepID=A0A4C1SFG0_EUMVA|nr:hypothetical protein EVAR_74236_1 [Eumeta japonica]